MGNIKVISESEKLKLTVEKVGDQQLFYRQLLNIESKPVQIYSQKNDFIEYNLEIGPFRSIIFDGTEELPKYMSSSGFGFKEASIKKFFQYKVADIGKKFIYISDHIVNEEARRPDALYFTFDEMEELVSNIRIEQKACDDNKKMLVNNFLSDRYPELNLNYKETNNNKRLILRNLNSKLIDQLTADEVEKIGEFYVEASKKYVRPDLVKRMIMGFQKNAQLLTLQEIIKKYEKLLEEDPAESVWQQFFDEYITLFDNRYAKKLDYKNIATGITKFPDLVLVDIYGYIDFYELKKCSTKILQHDTSHKTYYWSGEFSKVIAQAADYLQKAKENSLSYAKTIKEQTATSKDDGIEVSIINPRAIIVAGTTKELDTPMKQNHFKTLRESLKDIEFVLYDELLDRLKNLLEIIKLGDDK